MSTVLILADFSGDKASKTTAELATAAARIGAVTAVVLANWLFIAKIRPDGPVIG